MMRSDPPSPGRAPTKTARAIACMALVLLVSARARAMDAPTMATPSPSLAPVEAPAGEAQVESPVEARTVAEAEAVAAPRTLRARDEAQGLLNLGTSLTDRNDFEAAEIAYRQILNSTTAGLPETKSALLGLARMHRKKGELTKAAAIYERYLKEYPGDNRTPDALLDLGRTLRDMGAHRLAITRFYSVMNSTLKLPPEGFDHYQMLAKTAQFEIAETHFRAGEFTEANKFFSLLRLLDLAPEDRARAHFKAAYSLHLNGNNEAAVTTLRSYLDQWPDDENVPEARYLLAISLRQLNRRQEAFAATLDLLRTEQSRVDADPKRWAYWQRRTGNQLANDFFETGDTFNAHAIYLGLAALSPEPAWRLPITYQIGLCYERLGVTDRARSAYQSIIDGAAANAGPELAELARMARWRIDHLDWRETAARQVTAFFETSTGNLPIDTTPTAANPDGSP